jgi:hypothetical protein
MNISMLVKLVDASKLGGWVRAGVAVGLGYVVAHVPVLTDVLTPAVQDALGAAASGIVIGAWSHVAKDYAA